MLNVYLGVCVCVGYIYMWVCECATGLFVQRQKFMRIIQCAEDCLCVCIEYTQTRHGPYIDERREAGKTVEEWCNLKCVCN